MNIVIYRKDVAGPKYNRDKFDKAPTKADKAEADEALEFLVRVRRPELEDFLRTGFYALPALSPKCIDNRGHRLMRHGSDGWEVPAGSQGRNPAATKATAQSILLWIKANMGHVVNPEHVSIVVQ